LSDQFCFMFAYSTHNFKETNADGIFEQVQASSDYPTKQNSPNHHTLHP
jgi:hypothetical protein